MNEGNCSFRRPITSKRTEASSLALLASTLHARSSGARACWAPAMRRTLISESGRYQVVDLLRGLIFELPVLELNQSRFLRSRRATGRSLRGRTTACSRTTFSIAANCVGSMLGMDWRKPRTHARELCLSLAIQRFGSYAKGESEYASVAPSTLKPDLVAGGLPTHTCA